MVSVSFHMEKADYEIFKSQAGDRNIAKVLRDYALSFVKKGNVDEKILRREHSLILKQKEKIDGEFKKLQLKIGALEKQRELDELNEMKKYEEQQELMSKLKHDTIKKDLWRKV